LLHTTKTFGTGSIRVSGIAILLLTVALLLPNPALSQRRSHEVFFEGTDYELHVYRIYGKIPGKTLLLVGGIQGDEPGGFLSVDHYADISLAKGNLIVVPRANFHSIVLGKRKINEDMNRKFADETKPNYEAKIVAILKRLIRESDCLLNLHDGSGFFSKNWVDANRNPLRYGQSIIADAESYQYRKNGKKLALGDIARWVIAAINRHIDNPNHYFHFNNHQTQEKSSKHKEQRKSATYYALYTCEIPAFGIETSKSLSLEIKVRHHNLAINAFMARFGIVQETPGVNLETPKLDYLVIAVNGALPVVIRNQQTLYLDLGDSIHISHIEANYERGLTADLVDFGTINDVRKEIKIDRSTWIVVRKDYYPCGKINIALKSRHSKILTARGNDTAARKPPMGKPSLQFFKTRINGKERTYGNNDHVQLIRGDLFEIVDVSAVKGDPSGWIVNFKGFVGDRKKNTGEDRGYVIHTGKDLWPRYSLKKQGKLYQVIVTFNEDIVGKLFVDINDPEPGKKALSN
jgi:helical cell shape controlling family carboxypeptidase